MLKQILLLMTFSKFLRNSKMLINIQKMVHFVTCEKEIKDKVNCKVNFATYYQVLKNKVATTSSTMLGKSFQVYSDLIVDVLGENNVQ